MKICIIKIILLAYWHIGNSFVTTITAVINLKYTQCPVRFSICRYYIKMFLHRRLLLFICLPHPAILYTPSVTHISLYSHASYDSSLRRQLSCHLPTHYASYRFTVWPVSYNMKPLLVLLLLYAFKHFWVFLSSLSDVKKNIHITSHNCKVPMLWIQVFFLHFFRLLQFSSKVLVTALFFLYQLMQVTVTINITFTRIHRYIFILV